MSGTKIKTLLKNLKTQNETTIETFQELPLTIQDDSTDSPVNLKVSLTENSVDLRPVGGNIGLGISASTISLGSSTTVVGSTLSANALTDGTATLSGGVLTANTLTDGTVSLSGGVISSADDITLVPAQADGQVYIARDSGSDGPIGLTISKPLHGSAYLSVVEGTYNLYGGRLAYEGDNTTLNSDGVAVESLGVGIEDYVALQALDVNDVHNVLSYKYNGQDVTLESTNDITLKPGQDSLVKIESASGDIRSSGSSGYRLSKSGSTWELGSFNESSTYPAIKSHVEGYHTSMYSRGSVNVALDTDANSSGLRFAVYKSSVVDPTGGDPVDSGATELFKVDGDGVTHVTKLQQKEHTSVLYLGATEAEDTDGNAINTSVQVNAANNITLGINTVTDNISLLAGTITVGGDLVPSSETITIKQTTEYGGPVGLIIEKPVQGSAFLTVTERHPQYEDRFYGGRLALEGDVNYTTNYINPDESMGIGNISPVDKDYIALQGLDNFDVYNVLQFTRTGADVTLKSEDTLKLRSTDSISIVAPRIELPELNQTGSSVSGVKERYLGVRTSTGDLGDTGYTNELIVDQNSSFFSAGHIYHSPTSIPTGMAVCLEGNDVVLTSTPSSRTVVGIVARQEECSEENQIDTSLGESLTSGYATKIASVGDSRYKDCQGFNVCNENGDIQPGDLLVTSNTPGYLMKQDDDIIRSCTVGKAMEAVTFDENGQATGVYGYLYCG